MLRGLFVGGADLKYQIGWFGSSTDPPGFELIKISTRARDGTFVSFIGDVTRLARFDQLVHG